MVLVTAFQCDGSDLNWEAYNRAYNNSNNKTNNPEIPFTDISLYIKPPDWKLFRKLLLNISSFSLSFAQPQINRPVPAPDVPCAISGNSTTTVSLSVVSLCGQ